MRIGLWCVAIALVASQWLGCAFSEKPQPGISGESNPLPSGRVPEAVYNSYQISMPFYFGDLVTIKRSLSRDIHGAYIGNQVVYLHYLNQSDVEMELTFVTAPQLPAGQIRGRWCNATFSPFRPTYYDAGITDTRITTLAEGGAKVSFRAIIPTSAGFVGSSISLELDDPRTRISFSFDNSPIMRSALTVEEVEAAGVSISDQVRVVVDNGDRYELVGGLKLSNSSSRDVGGTVPFDLPVQSGSRETAWGWRGFEADWMVMISPEEAASDHIAQFLSFANTYSWFGSIPQGTSQVLLVYRKRPAGFPKISTESRGL